MPATNNNICSTLYAGSKFTGYQRSGRSTYNVCITIIDFDLSRSFMCGYLKIKGLTDDWPDLCTFFEGEIIGAEYSFLTRKWEANESIDRQHWSKFPSFAPLMDSFNQDGYVYDMNSRYLYMRWKEHFLVPDHKIKNINGASFAGFYYICFDKKNGTIEGIYFHQNSEWFQQLHLEHAGEYSFGSFEFR
jgi:glucose-induced degradation protein 4